MPTARQRRLLAIEPDVIFDPLLSPNAKLVYVLSVMYLDEAGAVDFLGLDAAAILGMDPGDFRDAQDELIEQSIITVATGVRS